VLKVLAQIRDKPSLDWMNSAFINYFIDKDFSPTNLNVAYSRSYYYYGGPLNGYDSLLDSSQVDQQENQFTTWWAGTGLRSDYDASDRAKWPTVEPIFVMWLLTQWELIILLVYDAGMCVLPILCVFLIVWIQTRSLFIAIVTLTEMVLSYTSAQFLMAVVHIQWIAFEQFLALYIVLAIGADDVFVFMDAYKASFYAGPEVNKDLISRMSWVYRRAGLAMLITSLTTCSAFIATAVSASIPTLQNFAIFASAVIFIDYTLVMTFLCSSVVIYHNMFEMKPGLCCSCCDCGAPESTMDYLACYAKKYGGCGALGKSMEATSTEIARTADVKSLEDAKPMARRFFEDIFPFSLFIKKPLPRALTVLAFIAVLGPSLWGVSNLQPSTAAEQFLPEDHPFQKFITYSSYFPASNEDSTEEMQLVWGLADEPMNVDSINPLFFPDDLGTLQYDSGFTLDAAAQTHLLSSCDLLKASDDVQETVDLETGGNATKRVGCFIESWSAYEVWRGNPFPVPGDAATVGASLYEWLHDGSEPPGRPEGTHAFEYESDVGFASSNGALTVRWVKLRANSLIKQRTSMPAAELRDYYNIWEGIAANINRAAPASLGSCYQICGTETGAENRWVNMILQEEYVRMALTGVGVSLGIAFIVLLISTQNLLVAFLCILTISCALCCVFANVVWKGWELGQSESLSMMVLTGFAVDYVVHLAHAYMESPDRDRLARTHFALRELGISVFWGMLTSVISAVVLSSLQLQFFAKFGLFFLLTIAWAYAWAVLFLMPVLATIGPQVKRSAA